MLAFLFHCRPSSALSFFS